jgi:hypothetical protein
MNTAIEALADLYNEANARRAELQHENELMLPLVLAVCDYVSHARVLPASRVDAYKDLVGAVERYQTLRGAR